MKKNKKKSFKVRNKKIKSKKKTQKKIYSKSKKKNKKKKKRIQKKRRISMTDIYPILNKIQLQRKTVTFTTSLIEADTVENTLKDLKLIYKRNNMKTQVEFTAKPNEEEIFKSEDELLEVEYLEDEIADSTQIFP